MVNYRLAGWTVKALIIGTVAIPSVALACRCIEPSNEEAYEQAQTVAYGTILSVAKYSGTGTVTYRFQISKQWKNPVADKITVTSGTTCAYQAKVGEKHLMYLSRTENGAYETSRCRGNRSEASAGETLRFLQRKAR